MAVRGLVVDENDNVVNLIGPGAKGDRVACEVPGGKKEWVELREDVPSNHKCARRDIKRGEAIVKYGFPVGKAVCDIPKGAHVHVHNVESNRGRGDLVAKGTVRTS